MTALIIAGFHRSGTSAVAQTLNRAGLFLGHDLLGSEPSNPHGHFEDNEVIEIHQALLDVNGVDWKATEPLDPFVPDAQWQAIGDLVRRRNALGEPWGFKDPRVCLFLPLWRHALPDARVLVVFRNPAETIRSLHMRHSRQMVVNKGRGEVHRDFWRLRDLGARMWLTYHRALLSSLPAPEHVHFVPFADRVAISSIATTLNERWGLGLHPEPNELDPDLGATNVDPVRVTDHLLVEAIAEVWTELHRHAANSAAVLNRSVS
ncbi:MAG: sulfotransferase [Acidimicrobiales bacterium]